MRHLIFSLFASILFLSRAWANDCDSFQFYCVNVPMYGVEDTGHQHLWRLQKQAGPRAQQVVETSGVEYWDGLISGKSSFEVTPWEPHPILSCTVNRRTIAIRFDLRGTPLELRFAIRGREFQTEGKLIGAQSTPEVVHCLGSHYDPPVPAGGTVRN